MVQFSVVIPSYGRFGDPVAMRRLIEAAEELGYHGAWFADHVALPDYATSFLPPPMVEPLAACAWGAGFTTGLRLGVDVLVAPYRQPVAAAATIASTAVLSGGRLILGVGVGYLVDEFAAVGLDPADRGARTDETLALWRALWEQSAPVSVAGDRFTVEAVHPVGAPVGGFPPGTVPLWVGGNITPAFRRAARLGDGWHPLFPTPEVYARGRSMIEAERARVGITRRFTYSYSGPLGMVLDAPRDWAAVAQQPAPPADTTELRPEFSYAPAPPHTDGGRPMLTGTPDELVGDVLAFAAAGVEHLLLRFWATMSELDVDGVIRQFELFAAQVAPRLPSGLTSSGDGDGQP